jgi:hypothetical protein
VVLKGDEGWESEATQQHQRLQCANDLAGPVVVGGGLNIKGLFSCTFFSFNANVLVRSKKAFHFLRSSASPYFRV